MNHSPFKVAVIKPLLKKTTLDSCILANYRPISNFPFLSKINLTGQVERERGRGREERETQNGRQSLQLSGSSLVEPTSRFGPGGRHPLYAQE